MSTGLDVRQGPVEILTQDQKRRAQGIGGRKQEGHRLDRPHAVGAYAICHPGVWQCHPNADINPDSTAGLNDRYPDVGDRVVAGELTKSALDRIGRPQILNHGDWRHL